MSVLAITGATGFVGKTVVRMAVEQGIGVRALTRRPQEPREGVTWIDGALDQPDSLDQLVAGADAVLHIAGVVNARDRAGFEAGNVHGTAAIVDAARGAGVRRFLHVSSLAAREPGLSDYGWSKARAEQVVGASGIDWTIVRPPAIYGPEDTELLEMFRMAERGIVILPPKGRLSVIEVSDLARLLLALPGDDATIAETYEVDDGIEGGWTHRSFARAIGWAVGKRVSTIAAPRPVLRIAARMDRAVRRSRAKLTPDRVRYFIHPDWVADPAKRPPAALWEPRINTRAGLKQTAAWYRRKGWLRG